MSCVYVFAHMSCVYVFRICLAYISCQYVLLYMLCFTPISEKRTRTTNDGHSDHEDEGCSRGDDERRSLTNPNDLSIDSVLKMAKYRKIQDLAIAADAIAERHESIEAPTEGWEAHLPKWNSKGAERGLKSWGSPKTKKGITWEVNGLCRFAIQKAFDFYVENIGAPPVKTGVPPKKKKQQQRRGRGLTRGQEVLVPGTIRINLFDTFIIVVRAKYCQLLDPPVEEGTINYDAIYAVLKQDGLVYKRAMSSVCVNTSFLYVFYICLVYMSCVYVLYIHLVYMSCIYVLCICLVYMCCIYVF